MGFHLIPERVGSALPHSKHASRPSGFTVPHEEQYTGFNVAPQLMQYLASGSLALRHDEQETNPLAIILPTLSLGRTVKEVFRTALSNLHHSDYVRVTREFGDFDSSRIIIFSSSFYNTPRV